MAQPGPAQTLSVRGSSPEWSGCSSSSARSCRRNPVVALRGSQQACGGKATLPEQRDFLTPSHPVPGHSRGPCSCRLSECRGRDRDLADTWVGSVGTYLILLGPFWWCRGSRRLKLQEMAGWTWGDMGTDGLASLEAQGTEGGRLGLTGFMERPQPWPHACLWWLWVWWGAGVPKRLGTASAPQFSILLEVRTGGSVMKPWGLAKPALCRGPGLPVA